MVNITHDGQAGPQSYEAELTDLDLPANVNYGTGATAEEATEDLKARVSDYIEYLQGADWTPVPIRSRPAGRA